MVLLLSNYRLNGHYLTSMNLSFVSYQGQVQPSPSVSNSKNQQREIYAMELHWKKRQKDPVTPTFIFGVWTKGSGLSRGSEASTAKQCQARYGLPIIVKALLSPA